MAAGATLHSGFFVCLPSKIGTSGRASSRRHSRRDRSFPLPLAFPLPSRVCSCPLKIGRRLMRSVGRLATAILLFTAIAQAQTTKPADEVWAIRAATLLDGKSDAPMHDKAIVIRGNRIAEVIDAGALGSRNIARVVTMP